MTLVYANLHHDFIFKTFFCTNIHPPSLAQDYSQQGIHIHGGTAFRTGAVAGGRLSA